MVEEEVGEVSKHVHGSWESAAVKYGRYHTGYYQQPIKGCSKTKLEEKGVQDKRGKGGSGRGGHDT